MCLYAQERVDTLKHQRRADRVPPGWALRNLAISATHTSRTTTSSGTGPAPTSAVLHNPRSAGKTGKAPVNKSNCAAGSADSAYAAGNIGGGAEDSDTPDEKDIKIMFEDVSSSSGEFDLIGHRER